MNKFIKYRIFLTRSHRVRTSPTEAGPTATKDKDKKTRKTDVSFFKATQFQSPPIDFLLGNVIVLTRSDKSIASAPAKGNA